MTELEKSMQSIQLLIGTFQAKWKSREEGEEPTAQVTHAMMVDIRRAHTALENAYHETCDVCNGVGRYRPRCNCGMADCRAEIICDRCEGTGREPGYGSGNDLLAQNTKLRNDISCLDKLTDHLKKTKRSDNETIEKLGRLNKEFGISFDLYNEAAKRATDRWRAENPEERELTCPDHAKLCQWLMAQLRTAEKERDEESTIVEEVARIMKGVRDEDAQLADLEDLVVFLQKHGVIE